MKVIREEAIAHNTGMSFEARKGKYVRVEGESTCDFVAFNLNDLRERFDQARTKVNQLKLFLSTGDRLISKSNNTMMTMVEDTYTYGTHDLEKGMCSRRVYHEVAKSWPAESQAWLNRDNYPDHGCWENLSKAVEKYGIAPEDIPSPLNLFQTVGIDGKTGRMMLYGVRPKRVEHVDLRAEMDMLVAVSACPEGGWGKPLRVTIYEK